MFGKYYHATKKMQTTSVLKEANSPANKVLINSFSRNLAHPQKSSKIVSFPSPGSLESGEIQQNVEVF